jgi:hypothetical protein
VGVKRRSIFDDPGLRAALIKLMGAAEFTRMVAHFEATVSANVVNGFLILTGWPDHDAPHAYLVIVNLDSGDVWAARQGESAVQWYGERVPSRAPDCLIADFLARKQEMY